MKKILSFLNRFLPPILVMALIFYLSSRSSFSVSPKFWLNFFVFKTLHFLEFGLLFLLWARAFLGNKNRFWLAFLLSFFWALTDEVHQLFVPTREGTIRDMLIDTAGILFFWWLLWSILPKAPKKLKNWAKKLALI